LHLGAQDPHLPTPWQYLLVSRAEQPWLRICLHPGDDPCCFQECLYWKEALWIGFGRSVYRVSSELKIGRIPVDFYFGSFYSLENSLLVCSGTRLYRASPTGELLWTSAELGVDGVIVSELRDDAILGEGEWDPPGGWLPFQISLLDGR